MRWLSILICCLGLAAAAQACAADAAADVAPDERTAAYRQFRNAFDSADFASALPFANQVTELTRSQFGAEAQEMSNPLVNLATTYLRMGQFEPAADHYREALKLLELQGDSANLKLVPPLHGMGIALQGLKRDDDAIVPLKRAVDIIRNRNGLRAIGQLRILNALADSYANAGHVEEAGREHQYAYTTAETAYGSQDVRLLGQLDKLAQWDESIGSYTAARALHLRAVEIADVASPGSLLAINGLRGVARSYRLAYSYGETEDALLAADALPGTLSSSNARAQASLSTLSERPLRDALQRLDAAPGDNNALRGAVLVDLGDWYLTGRSLPAAAAAYEDAWQALSKAGDTFSLATPVALVYRPPPMAVSRKRESPDEYTEQVVELRVSIAANGELRAVTVANPSPEREAAERATITAARRALWRPAIINGKPAAVTDFIFREQVNIHRPKAN